jgi:uncharacterized Zn-finger protein
MTSTENVISLVCSYCNKTYANISSLNHHQKTAKSCLKIQEDIKKKTSEFRCNFCDKNFSNQSNLIHHQKTTQSCLIIREVEEDTSLICIGCKKKFTTNANYDRHISICIDIKNKENQDLKDRFLNEKKELEEKFLQEKKQLQDEIKEQSNLLIRYKVDISALDSKVKMLEKINKEQQEKYDRLQERLFDKATSKTNTNVNNNNIDLKFFLFKEDVDKEINDNFTYQHILKGITGVANFLKDNIVTKNNTLMYKCIDPSRQIFKYTDSDGNEIKDIKASKLLEITRPGFIEKTSKLQSKSYNEYTYLTKRYNGEDEVADEDTLKRINKHKMNSEKAQDLLLNNFYDDKFSGKMSKELVKLLTC